MGFLDACEFRCGSNGKEFSVVASPGVGVYNGAFGDGGCGGLGELGERGVLGGMGMGGRREGEERMGAERGELRRGNLGGEGMYAFIGGYSRLPISLVEGGPPYLSGDESRRWSRRCGVVGSPLRYQERAFSRQSVYGRDFGHSFRVTGIGFRVRIMIVGVRAAREMEGMKHVTKQVSPSRRKGEIGCLFTLQMESGSGGLRVPPPM